MKIIRTSNIIFLVISFMISIPFITNRYIFLLDFISIVYTFRISELFYGKAVPYYGGFLPVLAILTLTDIFQKILIFAILFYGIYLMYDFANNIISSRIVTFYAGILYIVNSYVYIRILAGQLFFLLSYAIFPLLLKAFIDLLEKQQKKETVKFIFALSIVAFNIHMLVISLIIMIIIFIFWFNKYKDIKITKLFAISGILFILLNSYWIIPVLTAKNTIVDNITDKDIEVFAPKGSLFEIAAMYGFWREGYIYTKDILHGWQILYLIILSLSIIGFLVYYKDEKIGYLVKALGVIWIIGFVLATGINGPFGDINHWLYDNTILKGFRDSHKFVAMIVLAYAILGGLGVNKIKSIYDKYDIKNGIRGEFNENKY